MFLYVIIRNPNLKRQQLNENLKQKSMHMHLRYLKLLIFAEFNLFSAASMPVRLTDEQRHRNMAAIHASGTKPEMVVRHYLWSRGFRYRVNDSRLPGKPDLVLRKYRACIFVNGCFWHGHLLQDGEEGEVPCRYYTVPKTNTSFWQQKVTRNRERDARVRQQLAAMGWHTIVLWECQLKPTVRNATLLELESTLSHLYLYDRRPSAANPHHPSTMSPASASPSVGYLSLEPADETLRAAEQAPEYGK